MKSSKNQLTIIVEKNHIVDLHNSCTGDRNITIQEILEHLCENYGDVDESDLEK